ncbi:helix-turn-helix transcriptional regulator [Vibrio rarus]|uniref:helix-turn-helix transcriptional regulator n=1 Tax=Vibrio rarus TaxID=413403 RepID=UPI0021C2724D|nr:helix-turn-helix transcriptional regulator [Vibrio rarus]
MKPLADNEDHLHPTQHSAHQPIPLVRADIVNAIIMQFEKQGFDTTKTLQQANISRGMLFDANNMILNDCAISILGQTYQKEGILPFANAIASVIRDHLIPDFVKTLPKALTVREVLTKFNLLIRDSIPAASQYLEVGEHNAWFCSAFKHTQIRDWQEVFNILYTTELVRALTNNYNWKPKMVSLQQGLDKDFAQNIPRDIQLLFSQSHTKISVDLDFLDQTIKTPYPEPKPREIIWHSTFTDTVYTALAPYIHEQRLDIELAAKLFGMSCRTLQRKLHQEKSAFRTIKNSLMFNTACELMSLNLSLTQVSVQLGYADISHFSRAFKRFSGLTPKQYQAALLDDRQDQKS